MLKSKVLFVLFVVGAVAYAVRLSLHLPDHYAFDSWVLLVLSLNAGILLERWRRPEEESEPEAPPAQMV